MTDEELESMEIDWTQGVAENFERVKSAALAALDAANKRADEAEAERAEQWRQRREAEGSRDAAKAACDTLRAAPEDRS